MIQQIERDPLTPQPRQQQREQQQQQQQQQQQEQEDIQELEQKKKIYARMDQEDNMAANVTPIQQQQR